MIGKLIIIEGGDGSGKATQTEKLFNKLCEDGYKVMKVEFPNYKSSSSALVKMYLEGLFGDKPEDVNAYAASTFFSVDRYASYKTEWEKFYTDGGIIIADRYTTANMIHQASKIKDNDEKERFLNWLWDLEFNLLGLPKPDMVFLLNMPPTYSKYLITDRKNKFSGEEKKDIHEKNFQHLLETYNTACRISEKYNWHTVNCIKEDEIRTIDEIHKEIYEKVIKIL